MRAVSTPDEDLDARLVLLSDRSLTNAARQAVKEAITEESRRAYPEAWRVRESLLELKRPTGRTGSAETHSGYERDLFRFFTWSLDVRHQDPLAMSQLDLKAYVENLELGYSGSTTRRHFAAVSAFYGQAIAEGQLSTSPVGNIPLPSSQTRPANDDDKVQDKFRVDLGLDADDAASLVAAARSADPGTRALVLLLLANGLRVSEVCALQVRNVRKDRRGTFVGVVGKGKRIDEVALASEPAEAVEEAIARRKEGPLCLREKKSGQLVPYDRHSARRALIEMAARAGIEAAVWPHRLRHSFVSLAIDGGVPIEMVSRHARHSSVETTMRYARTLGDHDEHSTHTVMEAITAARRP